ncbi:MAG: primosomal protein N' [Rhodothermales bacterium]|nr:primosomal protein N' [Rhodothermales bacterium]
MSESLVNVILPLPLDRAYTYRVPPELDVQVGSRVSVPFSGRILGGVVVEEGVPRPESGKLADVRKVLDEGAPALTGELLDLSRWVSEYYACSWGEAARAALPPEGSTRTQLFATLVDDADASGLRGIRQQAVIAYLTTHGSTPVADVVSATGAGHATVRGLEEKGFLRVTEEESLPDEVSAGSGTIGVDRFHPTQRSAAEALAAALADKKYRSFLLHGVTGSGKTEVYIDALQRTIDQGRSGVVLVPEIALTPQTVRRFRRHFGAAVAVLHSRLSAGARFDTWRRIRRGDYRVVIGPRSAVFAPVKDLGLIVVDEEHESSYKQFEPAPRYNARDVAVVRASMNDAVCVLGSATPSLESFQNAKAGKYTLLSMPDRVPLQGGGSAKLPRVQIIDLLAARSPDRPDSVLSVPLQNAITRRLEKGEQIILLQNRRGFSPVLSCDTCGKSPECPDCSVSLTWHKPRNQLRCHYCGRSFRTPSECRECGTGHLEPVGAGTQRVEDDLGDLFPEARVLRMDLDTTGRKDAHDDILNAFGEGNADILVGTQMVAKGLDFERVTLVGVVDADAGLLFPDFRADERTFQLLTQVAGRAGRSDLAGEVIFQTRNPRHPVILHAKRHDYLAFASETLATREFLKYPPFVRAIRVEFRGPDEPGVRLLAERFANMFGRVPSPLELIGPAPAFVARVRKSWRYLALLKAPRSLSGARTRQVIEHVVASLGRVQKGYRINIDVDPMGML